MPLMVHGVNCHVGIVSHSIFHFVVPEREKNMHFSTILDNSCLQDVINSKPRRGAITLAHSDTISHALETLATNQLLSAPIVVYPDVEDNGAGMDVDATPTLIGWLDLRVCLDLDRRAVGRYRVARPDSLTRATRLART